MSNSRFFNKLGHEFVVNLEVVPPATSSCGDLPARIAQTARSLSIDAINLADSPMAKPKMAPTLFAGVLRPLLPTGVEIIPHITVRDRNRVALQGLIWGAAASGVQCVLIVSGDPVQFGDDQQAASVADLSIPDLIRMARQAGLTPGVVFDSQPPQRSVELRKLEKKATAGAGLVITQPVYSPQEAETLANDLVGYQLPILLGILPLVSLRHARFLHEHVPGIAIPDELMRQMETAGEEARARGISNARRMLALAKERFAGVCIMPPFHLFSLMEELLEPSSGIM